MCVILISSKARPSEEMVEKAYGANPSGAGVAWREGGKVKWKKGLDLEEAQELIAKVPTPFVAHFRIPSSGGYTKTLCHPFPIHPEVPLTLEGAYKGYVLFHNGHWGTWKSEAKDGAIKAGAKIPGGKWSDSRAMAFMAYHYGLGILDMIDEKVVAFGPDDIEIYNGPAWSLVEGIWCSNRFWESHGVSSKREVKNAYEGPEEKKVTTALVSGKDQSTDVKDNTGVKGNTAKQGGGTTEGVPFRHQEMAMALFKADKLTKTRLKKILKGTRELDKDERLEALKIIMAERRTRVPILLGPVQTLH